MSMTLVIWVFSFTLFTCQSTDSKSVESILDPMKWFFQREDTRGAKYQKELKNLRKEMEQNKQWTKEMFNAFTKGNAIPTIAFLARRDGDWVNLGTSATLVYNNVLMNTGNGYNGKTGVFTAPVQGTYSFAWSVLTPKGSSYPTAIVRNGSSLTYNFCYCSSNISHMMCTQTALIYLKIVEKVWIKTHHTPIKSAHGGTWPVFQGFRI